MLIKEIMNTKLKSEIRESCFNKKDPGMTYVRKRGKTELARTLNNGTVIGLLWTLEKKKTSKNNLISTKNKAMCPITFAQTKWKVKESRVKIIHTFRSHFNTLRGRGCHTHHDFLRFE